MCYIVCMSVFSQQPSENLRMATILADLAAAGVHDVTGETPAAWNQPFSINFPRKEAAPVAVAAVSSQATEKPVRQPVAAPAASPAKPAAASLPATSSLATGREPAEKAPAQAMASPAAAPLVCRRPVAPVTLVQTAIRNEKGSTGALDALRSRLMAAIGLEEADCGLIEVNPEAGPEKFTGELKKILEASPARCALIFGKELAGHLSDTAIRGRLAPLPGVENVHLCATYSLEAMLAQPLLKKMAWTDILTFKQIYEEFAA